MGDSKNEWELLIPLVPFLLVAPSLKFLAGWESVEAAFLIVVVPLLTFPAILVVGQIYNGNETCLLYTSPSPRDQRGSRMPSSA